MPLREPLGARAPRLLIVHDEGLGMDFGPDHPGGRRRHRLAMALAREAGLLAGPDVRVVPGPEPLPDAELHRVFAPAFVAAVRRYSGTPIMASAPEATLWGIGGDNPAHAGMHEDAARLAGASRAAALAVARGEARRALVPAGGTHHGLANRAMGFGLYNDSAMAVRAFLDEGAERVAYVDVDVHHGNGTESIFRDDPRVVTISVHESGRHLFPGSGFPHESGGAAAPGTSVNVALPPFAGDDAYRRALAEIVVPVVEAFRPEAMVTQCGVDSHHADPLAHLRTTLPLFPWMWRTMRELADGAAGGRWVALGGGGYEHCSVPPRAWALLIAEMLERPRPAGPLPARWRDEARAAGCARPPADWLDDSPPPCDQTEEARVAAAVAAALRETRAAVGARWGLPVA